MTRTYWKVQKWIFEHKTWKNFSIDFDDYQSAENWRAKQPGWLRGEKFQVIRIEETIKEFLDEGEEYEVACFSKYHYSNAWDRSDSVKFYSKSEAEEYIKKMEKLHPSWSDTVYRFALKKIK